MPKSSLLETPAVLIAAVAARALAVAARRAGYLPLTLDFFADCDTQRHAARALKLPGAPKAGMRRKDVLAGLACLAKEAPSPPIGVIYGSGFDAHAPLLDAIAARWPLLGNTGETVTAVKDPSCFFAELSRLGIAHPEISSQRPRLTEGWLAKRIGGAGGSHIHRADISPRNAHPNALYYQRFMPGKPISLMFAANGMAAIPLGFTRQWPAPSPQSPFRYGGAAGPVSPSVAARQKMCFAVEAAAAHFSLKGLGSADFLVDGDEAWLLEINPRPGATLDLFDSDAAPVLQFHLDGVRGRKLPNAAARREGVAAAIVYAPGTLSVPIRMDWPDWAADLPQPGERIREGAPVCTVTAQGANAEAARRAVQERIAIILAALAAPWRTARDKQIATAQRQ